MSPPDPTQAIAKATLEATQRAADAAWASAAIAAAALLVTIIAGVIVYRQLRSQRWMALLAFEQDLQARRREFDEIADLLTRPRPPANLDRRFAAAKEGYLNAVERLASSILNGEFPMREMKQDYRSYITNVMTAFPDQFGAATPYRKVKKLYDRWQD